MAHRMQERGFTLIELMITMTVLCFGLLGLAGLQVHMVRASSFNGSMTIATAIGTDLIEEAKAAGTAKLEDLVHPASAVVYGDIDDDGILDLGDVDIDGDGKPDDPYNSRFTWTRSFDKEVAAGVDYYRVNVSVFWNDSIGKLHRLDFATVVG